MTSEYTDYLTDFEYPKHADNANVLFEYFQITELAMDTFHQALFFGIMRMWHKAARYHKEFGYKHNARYSFYKDNICSTFKIGSNIFAQKMRYIESLGLWEYSSTGANMYQSCSVKFTRLDYEGFSPEQFVKEHLMAVEIETAQTKKQEKERQEKVSIKELLSDYKATNEDENLFIVLIINTMKQIAVEKQIAKNKKEKFANFGVGDNRIAAIKIYEKLRTEYAQSTDLELREIIICWLKDFYEKLKAQYKLNYFNPCGIIVQLHIEAMKAKKAAKKIPKNTSITSKKPKKNAKDPVGNPV